MFVNKIVKVQFPEQQLDDYVLENSVLKSKLQSKIDALTIMSNELDKCSMERDKYKILVEQLKTRNTSDSFGSSNKYAPTNTISGGEILARTKEQNDMLKLEVETLKSKLEEANGDITALRKQLQKNIIVDNSNDTTSVDTNNILDYEQLLQELEKVQNKYRQLQMDYRATLDEKEELVSDRDYYKQKVNRLNHQISFLLSNRAKNDESKSIVDIDALVMENKYLHESITQMQVEKEIAKRTLTKYKVLLDSRSKNNSVNFRKGFADVMTQKQVRDYLTASNGLKHDCVELRSVCAGLYEALNDKSIALQHQRKTNRILANRISELEKTMENWCNGQQCIPIFPSKLLMEDLDTNSVKSDDSKDIDRDISKTYSEEEVNFDSKKELSKIVLPEELQLLVKEALAEMKGA